MTAPLEEEHNALLEFLYVAPVGLIQAQVDGEIVLANPLCAQWLMPLSSDGMLANLFDALHGVAPELRGMVQALGEGTGTVCEGMLLPVYNRGVTRRDARILKLTLLKLDSKRLMAVLDDVSESIRRERELRQSQAWMNTIALGLIDYALVSLDAEGRLRDWNLGVHRVTGFDRQASIGHSMAMFYPPGGISQARIRDRLHEAEKNGWSQDEGWRLRADGTRFWGSCLIAPLHNTKAASEDSSSVGSDGHAPSLVLEEDRCYSLIVRDISERREAHESLRHAMSCDELTGLSNRRAFLEAAELEMLRWRRAPRPLSLLMIDADHFKQINDRHGHAAGDAVLRHLAAGLASTLREIDVVARMGGEEFVALLPGTGLDGAENVALRISRNVAAQPALVDGQPIPYTVSVGVATMEPELADILTLLQRADAAMYLAKRNGRNRAERWRPDAVATDASQTPLADPPAPAGVRTA